MGRKLAIAVSIIKKLSCHWEYSGFAILAKTDLGDWICLTSTVPQETLDFSYILVSEPELTPTANVHQSTVAFKQEIDELLNSLAPVTMYGHFDAAYGNTYQHQIICDIAPDEDLALQKALKSSLLLKVSQFKTFYPDPRDELFTSYSTKEEGTELCERYQHFNSFFSRTFTELLMLDFSFWDRKHIFIVGRSPINDWVGVRLTSEFSYNP